VIDLNLTPWCTRYALFQLVISILEYDSQQCFVGDIVE
jgi:hypothetical protein